MKKVIITFNPDGVVTWEPMPTDAGFNPEKQAGILAMAGDMFGPLDEKPVKPHQFDKEYRVECTPEQREEIIRIAQELGVEFFKSSLLTGKYSPNLFWDGQKIVGTSNYVTGYPNLNWLPFPEFLARLKGEWEPAKETELMATTPPIGRITSVFIEDGNGRREVKTSLEIKEGQSIDVAQIIMDYDNAERADLLTKPKFKKGDRVRNLLESNYVKVGATGTVDEDNDTMPMVIWDSENMVDQPGKSNLRRAKTQSRLELIAEPAQEKPESDLTGKWIKVVEYCSGGPKIDEWVQVDDVQPDPDYVTITWGKERYNEPDKRSWNKNRFDLTDPRDSNPDEPVETVIPFDYDRWKSGDFVRVENGRGEEVTQLTEFDSDEVFPLIGVLKRDTERWKKNGQYLIGEPSNKDLRLVVLQTPQA